MQKRMKAGNRRGFTLIELIVVLAIAGVLAAIAVPSISGFFDRGKQINRMSIARTLYLASQNQLTKSKIEKSLKSTLTGRYYTEVDGVYTLDSDQTGHNNVSNELGSNFPAGDEDNRAFVHYISKPKGYIPGTGTDPEMDAFYHLLDAVIIDKTILNGAILMEYNIETGVVMSIFYGDEIEAFTYDASGGENANVTGGRGMDGGYLFAAQRRQGYYGVGTSGTVAVGSLPDVGTVNIYDGADVALDHPGGEKVNGLYGEFTIAKQLDDEGAEIDSPYDFEVIDAGTSESLIRYPNIDLNCAESFDAAVINRAGGYALYKTSIEEGEIVENGIDIGDSYSRYILVIDYIGVIGNRTESFGIKTMPSGAVIEPTDVRARLTKDGGKSVTSLTVANFYYGGLLGGGRFEIKSARHLNNLRYNPAGRFKQTRDIDMKRTNNEIGNFEPIEGFSGEYIAWESAAEQRRIKGLSIESAGGNVGLFAEISGSIRGLSLFQAEVVATNGGNVGAITGKMTGGAITQSSSYADVRVTGGGNVINAGGLVGHIEAGILDQSFNAGFFDTHADTRSGNGIGSVIAQYGNVGGLVGLNGGTVQNSFNNARVNVDDVELTDVDWLSHTPTPSGITSRAYLGGIVGSNNGTVRYAYATNFVPIYDVFGSVSGGIVGRNHGELRNNFFIANECDGETSVTKEELQSELLGATSAYVRGEEYESGDNSYEKYPYPILKNNNPFGNAGGDWGWEDILEEDVGPAWLFYYELYTDNTWGYSQNSFHAVSTLVPANSNKLVMSDGYGVELPFYRGGYTLAIHDELYIITVAEDASKWTIKKEGETQAWPAPAESESDDGDLLYRLFIPNYVTEGAFEKRSAVSLTVYKGVDVDMEKAEPMLRESFNPLFAPDTNGLIRSARHIDNIDVIPNGRYRQQLHVDFSLYYKELTEEREEDTDSLLTYTAATKTAVVSRAFGGSYNGNEKVISNIWIDAPAGDDVGLFAVVGDAGTVTGVTIRQDKPECVIEGRNRVGAIAGTNNGLVSACAVQTRAGGQVIADHPVTVRGTSVVGGMVGLNKGKVVDVSFVSTSGIPAVQATSEAGGIIGSNAVGASLDKVSYLAVAPNTSSVLSPFTGANLGDVTASRVYLAGTKATRPYMSEYNFLTAVPTEAKKTVEISGVNPFGWGTNNVTDTQALSQTSPIYPYPYPIGTVPPEPLNWPIVDNIVISSTTTIVYYERYRDENGNDLPIGIWAPEHKGTDGYLNNNGIVVESGYLLLGSGESSTNFWWYATWNGTQWVWAPERQDKYKFNDRPSISVPYISNDFFVIPTDLLAKVARDLADPSLPILVWFNSPGSRSSDPFGVACINPLFAKEVYSVEYTGTTVTSGLTVTPEYSIRTPWQMQNISYVAARNRTADKTFVQELNLNFRDVYTTAPSALDGVRPVITSATNAVVANPFDGTYDGNSRTISSLTLTNSANNKGLFQNIASAGTVKNLTLYNCKLQNGANTGGFASANSGTLENIAFVSTDSAAPVSGTDAGGIVSQNHSGGLVKNALYIALAPDGHPIAAKNDGDVNDAHYLSGSVSSLKDSTGKALPYNDYDAPTGTRGTTQELNVLKLGSPWHTAVPSSSNTVTETLYPYPYLGTAPPAAWHVATIPVSRLAYYEEYADGSMAFFASQDDELNEEENITNTGYCAVVPRAGGYSLKLTGTGSNTHVQADKYKTAADTVVHYVKLPSTIHSGSNLAIEVYVNDNQLIDENNRFVNTLFAKAVFGSAWADNYSFSIRTPQQMRNISRLTAIDRTDHIAFNQERNLDFNREVLNDSVVTGNFKGIYDGGGLAVAHVAISSSRDNVGLFSQNSGTIRRLTIDFGDSAAIRGTAHVGGVVGMNSGSGLVSDIAVVSTAVTAPVSGTNAGGVAGGNEGAIERVLYLALAPSADDVNYPIACTNSGLVTDAYYLSGSVAACDAKTTLMAMDFNTASTNTGEGKTTEELDMLDIAAWAAGWQTASEMTDVMSSSAYPYPYILTLPKAWPVAAKPSTYVAYYEVYGDGTYGYDPAGGYGLPALDGAGGKTIQEAGYCVIMPDDDTSETVQINEYEEETVVIAQSGKNIAKLPLLSEDDALTEILVNGKSTGMYINTLFAKAVYASPTVPSHYYIRTPEQMRNINKINTAGKVFTQTYDIDFTGVDDLDESGAVISSEFRGVYNGGGKVILGVAIESGFESDEKQGLDHVGLFSQNSGVIENITLRGDRYHPVNIIGKENVGAIAGRNNPDGVIQNCRVEGTEYTDTVDADGNPVATYEGVHIEAKGGTLADGTQVEGIKAGGVTGVNDGVIMDCAVSNTSQTIKADDYVGGIAGMNGTGGKISGAAVSHVRLEAKGVHIGSLVGWNDNTDHEPDENPVDGEADDVFLAGVPIYALKRKKKARR